MATWSHFTSYLDGTRSIAKAERDELYDNLVTLLVDCESSESLDSAAMTAIKDSGLLTDIAKRTGAAVERFEAVLQAVAADFSNFSTVESAALSAEGLSSTQRDAIVAAEIEDYRLWNYYRRIIDGLECALLPCDFSFANTYLGEQSTTLSPRCLRSTSSPPCATQVQAGTIYLSAQNLNAWGTVRARFYIDGSLVWDTGVLGPSDYLDMKCATAALANGAEQLHWVVDLTGASSGPEEVTLYVGAGCSGPHPDC